MHEENTIWVNSINGVSASACNCGSWLSHWIEFSGAPLPKYCPETSCTRPPEAGALVRNSNPDDPNWYVVPLCNKHYADTGNALQVFTIPLVSANIAETCGKQHAAPDEWAHELSPARQE